MLDPETPSATRRLDHAISRDRLRTVLVIAGVALLIGGLLVAIYPFGPPIANPVAIPKADPHAGLWLAQGLPSEIALRTGLIIAAVGVVMVVLSILSGVRGSRNHVGKKV